MTPFNADLRSNGVAGQASLGVPAIRPQWHAERLASSGVVPLLLVIMFEVENRFRVGHAAFSCS